MSGPDPKITQLLRQQCAGDGAAQRELLELVYAELHRIAKRHLRKERSGHTLQPTALVHEAYLRLFGSSNVRFADRAHFFAVVSRTMRRILVDHARARSTGRRSGPGERVPFETTIEVELDGRPEYLQLLELDLTLDALAQEKQSLAQVIEMRYFGGMTAEETAEVVGRSVHVVRHELRLAQAWLRREMAQRA